MKADRLDVSGKSLGTTLRIGITIAAYLLLNSSLNLLNKWALGSFFSFPLLLTTFHMLFSFVMLFPFMMSSHYISLHQPTLKRQWRGLTCIGVFMATNIALNNLSLVRISLSLNQVIRSAIPVATAVLAVSIEGKTPTREEFVSLLVLTAGVMISVWEGLHGSVLGIVFACCGMLSNAAMMSTSGRVLSEQLDVIRLTFYTAPVSCVVLAPFFLWREGSDFRAFVGTDPRTTVAVLLITSFNALAYNVVHYKMIAMTSAVTTTVIGEAKIIGLMALSALLLGEGKEWSVKMVVGVVTAMAGFCMFSHSKLYQAQAKGAAKSEPDEQLSNGDAPGSPEKQALLSNGERHSRESSSGSSSPQRALTPHRRINSAA